MSFVICEQLWQLRFVNIRSCWMAVFDEDMSKPWDEKIYNREIVFDGKTIHVVGL